MISIGRRRGSRLLVFVLAHFCPALAVAQHCLNQEPVRLWAYVIHLLELPGIIKRGIVAYKLK